MGSYFKKNFTKSHHLVMMMLSIPLLFVVSIARRVLLVGVGV